MRASHNAPGVGSNVDTSYGLVMPLELVLELKGVANPAIQLDRRVPSDGEGLPISREGVVRNGIVEEVMNFWLWHCGGGGVCDRSGSLLSLKFVRYGYNAFSLMFGCRGLA